MTTLKERIEEVTKNYNNLPKARDDYDEFVIIAEKDNGGDYEEYKECLGVRENGDLIWSYLSGCSCDGDNENEVIKDMASKTFRIDDEKTVEEFYNVHNVESYEAYYKSY